MSESVADDPKLAPLWDVGQNPQPARKVEARSFRPAVWRCAKGHTFLRSPRSMQNDPSCPTCSKGVNTHTNLGKLRPGLASLWDATQNAGINFATLDATHASPVRWRCPNGHSFQRPPVRMLADDACPTCALAKSSLTIVADLVAEHAPLDLDVLFVAVVEVPASRAHRGGGAGRRSRPWRYRSPSRWWRRWSRGPGGRRVGGARPRRARRAGRHRAGGRGVGERGIGRSCVEYLSCDLDRLFGELLATLPVLHDRGSCLEVPEPAVVTPAFAATVKPITRAGRSASGCHQYTDEQLCANARAAGTGLEITRRPLPK